MKARGIVGSFVLAVMAVACARSRGGDDAGAPPAMATATAAEEKAPDEEVRPVYPLGGDTDPRAVALCEALHDRPSARRAACCGTKPTPTPASECARNVSAALRLGGVTLEAGAIDGCAKAMASSLDGCAWVSVYGAPVPPACAGILHGVFQTGQRCRSSLECAAGLHCDGVGPTDVGTCAAPAAMGGACSRGVDTLATFARQDELEAGHPACAAGASCRLGKCVAASDAGAKGASMRGEGEACAMPWDCRSGVCTAGRCVSACPAR